ncbi:hypothetical protein, partial [Piscinibacter gummiphilus]|uniref:hypothetical protein n=1 Tax=Piscinibacter gummiphilus TaxID=946333 RepID=UPI0024E0D87B
MQSRSSRRSFFPLSRHRLLGTVTGLAIAGGIAVPASAQTAPGPANCTALVGLQVDTGVVTASERFAKGASIAPSTSGGAGSLFGGDATV